MTEIPHNEASFALGDVAEAVGGVLREADPATRVQGVVIDSRRASPGVLFVAIAGAGRDGHAFAGAARAAGAAACVVRAGSGLAGPRVEVPDTVRALGALARAHAARVCAGRSVPSVAVGGASGKTTTKELLARALGALAGRVLATPGNLNNQLGLPLTLLTLGPEHAAVVLECGTSEPGEIARLGQIAAPDVALVLNATLEHAAHFPDVDAIADEECALFASARRAVVGNAGDARVAARLPRGGAVGCFTFAGEDAEGDVRLLGREATPEGRSTLSVRVGARLARDGAALETRVDFGLLGPAAAEDAAAAVAAVAAAWGGLDAGDLARVASALVGAEPVPGRLCPRVRAGGGALVLDDTYNANPASVRAALAAAAETARARGGRVVAVLGDMLDLGAASEAAHREVLAAVAERGATLVALGEAMHFAARGTGAVRARDADEAIEVAGSAAGARDVVLVKGSRGMAMERVVAGLCAR